LFPISTLRFQVDKPMPAALVKARVAQNLAKYGAEKVDEQAEACSTGC